MDILLDASSKQVYESKRKFSVQAIAACYAIFTQYLCYYSLLHNRFLGCHAMLPPKKVSLGGTLHDIPKKRLRRRLLFLLIRRGRNKAFPNTEEWCFPFLEYLFWFLRYWHFCIMQLRKVMRRATKILTKNISGNIESVFFKLGTRNIHQRCNKITHVVLLPWQPFCCWSCLN